MIQCECGGTAFSADTQYALVAFDEDNPPEITVEHIAIGVTVWLCCDCGCAHYRSDDAITAACEKALREARGTV